MVPRDNWSLRDCENWSVTDCLDNDFYFGMFFKIRE